MSTRHKKSWPAKNLKEIIDFLEHEHGGEPSLEEISKQTGLSTANLSAMFVKDDMKLSRAEEIVRSYGYELSLFFPLKEYPFCWESHVIRREFPNAGNLSGLVKYMYDLNMTINSMSKRINRSNCVLSKAFATGDIFLSCLYDIIKNFNIDIIWKYTKIDSTK